MVEKPDMKKIKENFLNKLELQFNVEPSQASDKQIYQALSAIIVEELKKKRQKFINKVHSDGKKQVYYLSMEFLMGRSLKTSLYNLEIVKDVEKMLKEYDIRLDDIYEYEPDAGLGNGGLGRLAACYLDALATQAFPAMGYSICYEYGIFKQKLEDGWQTELPDNWLPGGSVWLDARPEMAIDIHFEGELHEYWDNQYHHLSHVNYSTVHAIPYDMYVSGHDSEGVSVLRLWAAKAPNFDMSMFNQGDYEKALGQNAAANAISKVLYPNDNHLEGKSLRLRQQYFLCAASVGDIVNNHMSVYGTLDNLHEKVAIHINDTHPTLAIPELMRVLLDDCGYTWDKAWHIVTNTFAYTNHTVMAEALEKWDVNLVKRIIPRIFSIIVEINNRYCARLMERNNGDSSKTTRMSIIKDNQIHMATLCVVASHSINGVSKLHSEIIKQSVFNDEYMDTPRKFKNVTNGIAYRRWLYQSNPGLTNLLKEKIGDKFLKDGSELKKLCVFENDSAVLEQLMKIKRANKERFAKYVKHNSKIDINIDSIFDVQVKRLHEYKRQHLNVMNILADYEYLLQNPDADFVPKTYIFAAKAAPGYYLAKQIIKLIWAISEEIRKNPKISQKLSVYFLEDYRVTLSELLMPASDISEQISLAGTEASGTGNMKLMLNGAITLGTLDGANIEIKDAVGDENIIIFGMKTEEVNDLKRTGYNPESYYESNPVIKNCIDRMYHGINGCNFNEVANSLKNSDPYMVLADFDSYRKAQAYSSECYKDSKKWTQMSLNNIAGAGIFSADRAVTEYAKDIWGL
ncbi:glycogen/starch/alpha-glucan phosphorylase [Porcipelethomonas ammoniilytica]|uniref:glycogen/starch/alpha-glucan phosphorylase n=1 Tax=Porcipelethomonas ammoniilytica TaxID=2981722 RepID=UPI00082129B3|nr:glycogen/starch/alpha-glucan phosphorylase [Porcipelethomonas ammoniilytica]MCU6719805.1 glycogen/starch/alpha-glucan phosphorylase [Porcipelethomonas ammoniilytica]SCI92742.1 Maltodextrin phosphorylase [uncultured Ruminococcus sp.]